MNPVTILGMPGTQFYMTAVTQCYQSAASGEENNFKNTMHRSCI